MKLALILIIYEKNFLFMINEYLLVIYAFNLVKIMSVKIKKRISIKIISFHCVD